MGEDIDLDTGSDDADGGANVSADAKDDDLMRRVTAISGNTVPTVSAKGDVDFWGRSLRAG